MSTPIGVEGGGPQSGRQRLRQHWKQSNNIHWCHFQLHISHKAAKSIANSPVSRRVIYSCLVVCLSSYLKTTWALMDIWQASETSYRKGSLGNFQHQYLPELLFNVYSYRVMMKNESCLLLCAWKLKFSHIILWNTVVWEKSPLDMFAWKCLW